MPSLLYKNAYIKSFYASISDSLKYLLQLREFQVTVGNTQSCSKVHTIIYIPEHKHCTNAHVYKTCLIISIIIE